MSAFFLFYKKGTSLVELIAVIIIMGIIAGIAIPTTIAVIDRQKTNAAKNSANNVMAAAEPVLYDATASGSSNLPAGVEDGASADGEVYKITIANLVANGHLKENPLDEDDDVDQSEVYIWINANNKCYWSVDEVVINGKTVSVENGPAAEPTNP